MKTKLLLLLSKYFHNFRDYSIKLFDLRKMETVYTLTDENIPQYCESSISISSDKKYFTVGSTKGQIFIFNAATGKVLNCYLK
jgi:WD40 repeat protein